MKTIVLTSPTVRTGLRMHYMNLCVLINLFPVPLEQSYKVIQVIENVRKDTAFE